MSELTPDEVKHLLLRQSAETYAVLTAVLALLKQAPPAVKLDVLQSLASAKRSPRRPFPENVVELFAGGDEVEDTLRTFLVEELDYLIGVINKSL